jgi:hypothetical protein
LTLPQWGVHPSPAVSRLWLFLTFDANQRKLAAAEKLKVKP